MSNIDPVMRQALSTAFAMTRNKVQPVHPAAPVRHKIDTTLEEIADMDNALQNIEFLHMKLGEAIRDFRSRFNREIIPLPRRGERARD